MRAKAQGLGILKTDEEWRDVRNNPTAVVIKDNVKVEGNDKSLVNEVVNKENADKDIVPPVWFDKGGAKIVQNDDSGFKNMSEDSVSKIPEGKIHLDKMLITVLIYKFVITRCTKDNISDKFKELNTGITIDKGVLNIDESVKLNSVIKELHNKDYISLGVMLAIITYYGKLIIANSAITISSYDTLYNDISLKVDEIFNESTDWSRKNSTEESSFNGKGREALSDEKEVFLFNDGNFRIIKLETTDVENIERDKLLIGNDLISLLILDKQLPEHIVNMMLLDLNVNVVDGNISYKITLSELVTKLILRGYLTFLSDVKRDLLIEIINFRVVIKPTDKYLKDNLKIPSNKVMLKHFLYD